MLTLILALRQQFSKLINGEVKEINIKNQTYYFFDDIIDIKNFHSNLLKTYKKSYKDTDIYYIGYITIKKFSDCGNIHSVNPLYLIVHSATGYFKEKKGGKILNSWFNREIRRSFYWN